MKNPFVIFSAFIITISLLVYSCSTKSDPAVPDHSSNISSNSNSISLTQSNATYTYNFGFHYCGDSSANQSYSLSGKEISSGFIISVIFFDKISAPTGIASYGIVDQRTTPTLSSGQCYVIISAPSLSPTQPIYVTTGGFLNYDPNSGNPKAIVNSAPIENIGDATKTGAITGSWSCK